MDRGDMKILHQRDVIDGMRYAFSWFENTDLKSYSLESVCDLLALKNPKAHDSMADVYTTGIVIQRFLKLHRTCGEKVQFKNSCAKVTIPLQQKRKRK